MRISWTEDKIRYLHNNYNIKSAKEIAKNLGCTAKAVHLKAFKLGIKGRDPRTASLGLLKKFTIEDVDFLKLNYEQLGPSKCSEILNKNKSGLIKLAHRLGLKSTESAGLKNSLKHKSNRVKNSIRLKELNEEAKIFKTGEEVEYLIFLYELGYSGYQLATMFNCSIGPIFKVLKSYPNKRTSGDYPQNFFKNQGFGEEHHSWKGGYKSVYDRFRDLQKYWDWRKAVLDKDGHCCTKCNSTEHLHAHHMRLLKTLIDEYLLEHSLTIQDLKEEHFEDKYFYEVSNGLTLCETCHKAWHKEHGR